MTIPCPFCGNTDIRIVYNGLEGEFNPRCNSLKCGATLTSCLYRTAEEAIEAWNTRPAAQEIAMKTQDEKVCLTCKWWQQEENRYCEIANPRDPATYEQLETEEEIRVKWGHAVRHCKNPKILFYQRPEINGAAMVDGSEYHAALLTAEQFGCVLHERPNKKGTP